MREMRPWLVVLAVGALACGPKLAKRETGKGNAQVGLATWYGGAHQGGPTASGERFNKNALTAAHRTLPMNTRVRVTNQHNGRSVIVRINDRGPYGRAVMDVSEGAARKLVMIDAGVVPVRVELVRGGG